MTKQEILTKLEELAKDAERQLLRIREMHALSEEILAGMKILEDEDEVVDEPEQTNDQWLPKNGDKCFFVDEMANILWSTWDNDANGRSMLEMGNAFKTEREANFYILRQQAMAKRWKPEEEQDYWRWNFKESPAGNYTWYGEAEDLLSYFFGNIHRTKEDAEAWGKKYHEAFMSLMEK